jgi:hypothetical protein
MTFESRSSSNCRSAAGIRSLRVMRCQRLSVVGLGQDRRIDQVLDRAGIYRNRRDGVMGMPQLYVEDCCCLRDDC